MRTLPPPRTSPARSLSSIEMRLAHSAVAFFRAYIRCGLLFAACTITSCCAHRLPTTENRALLLQLHDLGEQGYLPFSSGHNAVWKPWQFNNRAPTRTG